MKLINIFFEESFGRGRFISRAEASVRGSRRFFQWTVLACLYLSQLSIWPAGPLTMERLGNWPRGSSLGPCSPVSVVGDRAYAAIGADGLAIMYVGDPTRVRMMGRFATRASAQDVKAVKNLAFVSETETVQGAFTSVQRGWIEVLDVSDPANVHVVGSFMTAGPDRAIQLVGDRAYVVDAYNGLQALDVSDPSNVRWLGGFSLSTAPQRPMSIAPKLVPPPTPEFRSAHVSANRACLLHDRAGLQFLDVSDPAHIVRLGSYAILAGDVQIAGNLAYVVDGDLHVLDLSDPSNIRKIGGLDAGRGIGSVEVIGSRAYLAGSGVGLQVVDVSDPANIRPLGKIVNRTARSVRVIGRCAYLSNGGGVQLFDVSDPAKMTRLWGNDVGLVNSVTIESNRAYVTDWWTGLQVWDASDPSNLLPLGGRETDRSGYHVQVIGDRAYYTDGTFQVLDVSDPNHIQRLDSNTAPSFEQTGKVFGKLAYVALSPTGFQIIDISDPLNLRLVGEIKIASPSDIEIVGDRAYALASSGALEIFDVKDPSKAGRLGGANPGSRTTTIQVVGNRAYVTDFYSGLQILDVSDPASVRLIGRYYPQPESGNAEGVCVNGNLACLAYGRGGLHVLDTTDPANVRRLGGFDTSGEAQGVRVVGNLAFVADGASGLQVIKMYGGPGFAPGFLAAPRSQDAPLGATVALTAKAAGTEPLNYQWQKDGMPLNDNGKFSGSTTTSLTIKALTTSDLGNYSIVVTNPAGSITSEPAQLTRRIEPFRLLANRSDLQMNQGTLTIKLSGVNKGDNVVVSRSTDLRSWLPWLTNSAPTDTMEFLVPWTPTMPYRFFRAARQ